MSRGLTITSVALSRADGLPARVDFSAGLTVVQGPSDTGKSFIADVIDFMFGSSSLREIPESGAYDCALIELQLAHGRTVTLRRRLTGGSIDLFEGSLGEIDLSIDKHTVLGHRHRANDPGTLSGFLLQEVGLLGRMIRRNKNNKLVSLSFRDVAHLNVIDEISIQSEVPPALSGQYTTATKEASALRALLEDTDDSTLIEVEDKSELRKVSAGQLRLVESMLDRLELEVRDSPDRDELRDRWAKLVKATERATDNRKGAFAERDNIGEARSRALRRLRARSLRISELSETRERLALLLAQYDSDMHRLDLMSQASGAMGYFASDTCAYCGAAAGHQREGFVVLPDDGGSVNALGAERDRTANLANDLGVTMKELDKELARQGQEHEELQKAATDLDRQFGFAEKAATPASSELRQLLTARSEVQRHLAIYEQIAELEMTRRLVELESANESAGAGLSLNGRVVDELSAELVLTLRHWGYAHADTVRYDRESQDVWADGQRRASHGKGVRALLHAAFTVSLAQYCLERDLPHPGFVVLDSPLITYRPADVADGGVVTPVAVAEMMYQDLANRFAGQAVVMENVDLPEGFGSEVGIVEFSGVFGVERYGFLERARS